MSHFYAYLSKLKYVNRWGIMRNTAYENDMEHSMQVTMVAHSLCEIKNCLFGGHVDREKVLLYAMYHEASEVITGDLPTPIKYYNQDILDSFKEMEHLATKKIFAMLPKELQPSYLFMCEDEDNEERRIVKAADKICAYLKCIEEWKMGNSEFSKAKESILKAIRNLHREEVDYWMDHFAESFALTIDKLN